MLMAYHALFPLPCPPVKIAIGHRLFASVLLAMLTVAAAAVLLLRQNVLGSFGDYAVAIELDRLDELSGAVARQYSQHGDWTFLPSGDDRHDWIGGELTRLQSVRGKPAPPVGPVRPVPPVDPAAPAAPAAPLHKRAGPPMPPLPPPPPAPPGVIADLHTRITLLDANGGYLAGRLPGNLPLARRAITVDDRTIGYLGVARSARPSDAMAFAFLDQLERSLWLIGGLALVLSALAAIGLARHFRRPIDRLARGAGALAAGDYAVRLPVQRSDELGDLARHFNALAERLDQAEAARRQWVADTSHELRTPLAVLRAQLEAIQDGVRQATPATVDAMVLQVHALTKLIDELYALARADVGELACQRVPLDLWQLATAEAQAFGARFQAAGLTFETGEAPAQSQVLGDPDRLRQVLANLFENSLRYTAHGGVVRLSAQVHDDQLQLTLDDSAPGVPDAALARLAERFYRVDASRSRAHGGAGLGLALSRRLLAAQGSALAFAHSPLGGLRVTVSLPLLKQEMP